MTAQVSSNVSLGNGEQVGSRGACQPTEDGVVFVGSRSGLFRSPSPGQVEMLLDGFDQLPGIGFVHSIYDHTFGSGTRDGTLVATTSSALLHWDGTAFTQLLVDGDVVPGVGAVEPGRILAFDGDRVLIDAQRVADGQYLLLSVDAGGPSLVDERAARPYDPLGGISSQLAVMQDMDDIVLEPIEAFDGSSEYIVVDSSTPVPGTGANFSTWELASVLGDTVFFTGLYQPSAGVYVPGLFEWTSRAGIEWVAGHDGRLDDLAADAIGVERATLWSSGGVFQTWRSFGSDEILYALDPFGLRRIAGPLDFPAGSVSRIVTSAGAVRGEEVCFTTSPTHPGSGALWLATVPGLDLLQRSGFETGDVAGWSSSVP